MLNNIYLLCILYLIIIILSVVCAYYSEKKYNNTLDIKTYINKEITASFNDICISIFHGTIYGFLELFILIYNYQFFENILNYSKILNFGILALVSFVVSSIISIFVNISLTNITNITNIISTNNIVSWGEILGFIIGGVIAILIIYYT